MYTRFNLDEETKLKSRVQAGSPDQNWHYI